MYSYEWDIETGGLLLNSSPLSFSREPRPVYYKELDILGFDQYWNYDKNDAYPYMWAEANNYWYRGRLVAKTKGGSLYTAPELIIVDEPEHNNAPLRFVDVPGMVEKNRNIIEKLTQDTIKKVYNTYIDYKDKVDIFHVSYSGGKDSEVALDIVQRALPHNAFVVIFGDTGMEFSDTYKAVDKIEQRCREEEIEFYRATSDFTPAETWKLFGPPSTTIRWCCSVHKTAPQLLKLRKIVGKSDFKEMAFVGVRADESVRRSEYGFLSKGTKHKGQYSYNPILEWNSAEIYLYLYINGLYINKTYLKGNSRAGCLVCPMSRDKSDFMRYQCYPQEVEAFMKLVKDTVINKLETKEDDKRYLETGGWKLRSNGRDIYTMPNKYFEKTENNRTILTIDTPCVDWKIWIKTIGNLVDNNEEYILENRKTYINFKVENTETGYMVIVPRETAPDKVNLIKLLKQVFRKSAYCIQCRECEADCQRGCISMKDGQFSISDNCIHCSNCHKPSGGCLLYKSLELPKGNGKMKNSSYDCYADHAPKMEWMREFFLYKDEFNQKNTLGSQMYNFFKRFLRHAELIENDKYSSFARRIDEIGGLNNTNSWALMLVNLSYTPEFNWYIKNISTDIQYSRVEIMEMLQSQGVLERGSKSITGAYKRILQLPFGSELGLGYIEGKAKNITYLRGHWSNPEPLVILYSLYKFAENCGDYYQFTLSRLLNHEIDSDGVSPTEIFGLNREQMERILNGLSVNYPEFITVSFTLDLDNITLRNDKTSKDVLELF